jgi:hypothetical protein
MAADTDFARARRSGKVRSSETRRWFHAAARRPRPAASHGAFNDRGSDHRDSARISDVQILKNGGEQVTKLRGYLPEMWCSTLVSEYFRSDEMRQYCSFIEISSAIY